MSRARLILGVGLVLALGACASQLQNDIFFDPQAKLDTSRSLAFTTGSGGTDANRKIAGTEIRTLLAAKGYQFTDPGRADLLIRFDMGRRAKVKLSGSATHGENAGLVVEIVDPATGRTLWHGLAYESWYDSMDPATEIRKAVGSVLSQFPPSS